MTRADFLAMSASAALTVGGGTLDAAAAPNGDKSWTPLLVDPDAVQVAGTLNGERIRVLIDTGAAATVVDRSLAQRLGLNPTANRSVGGDVGTVTLGAGDKLQVEIAGTKLIASRYVVADFSPIVGADASAPNLILGIDALKGVVLEIDFPARRLALPPRDSFAPQPSAERLPFTRSARGQLSIGIQLEGHDAIAAALDLGSSNPLTVSAALGTGQGLLQGRQVSSAATGGIDGISISRTVSIAALRIGQSLLQDVPCEVLAKTDPTVVPARLGLPVLERYLFALDVTGATLWLQPAPRLLSLPFRRDLSGLGLAVEAGHLRVVHVAQGGPAALAGWREGESIVAVNGLPIGLDYMTGELWKWRYGAAGAKVLLSMLDGTERALVLQRYY